MYRMNNMNYGICYDKTALSFKTCNSLEVKLVDIALWKTGPCSLDVKKSGGA